MNDQLAKKCIHIVNVHRVENGVTDLEQLHRKEKFEHQWQADQCVEWLNQSYEAYNLKLKAVYFGCVNIVTGELA
jgi:hypothetical protein